MRKYLVIYEEAVSHIWLCNRSNLDFLIYEKIFLFFFIRAVWALFDTVVWLHLVDINNKSACMLRYRVCTYVLAGWDLSECLTAKDVVATVLGSIPASSDTVESEGRQMKQCWILYIEKIQRNPPLKCTGLGFDRLHITAVCKTTHTVIRFMSVSAKFGTCTVVDLYGNTFWI